MAHSSAKDGEFRHVERIDEEEEDEEVCRICRTCGTEEDPLFYPCACSGSIKYVHQACLIRWLDHSSNRNCEVCKHPFSFSPVYAENAPATLSTVELIAGLFSKSWNTVIFILRLLTVVFVWLFLIPFTTCWFYRLTFVRSFTDASTLMSSRWTLPLLLSDCMYGTMLSTGIVVLFLGTSHLRDHFQQVQAAHRPRPAPAPANDERRIFRHPFVRVAPMAPPMPEDEGADDAAMAGQPQLHRPAAEPINGLDFAAPMDDGRQEGVGAVEELAEGHNFDFDVPEELDGGDDVPFDELVGMRGPIFNLVENSVTVLAINAIFLFLLLFLPFTIGRITMSLAAYLTQLCTMAAPLRWSTRITQDLISSWGLTPMPQYTASLLSTDYGTIVVGYMVIIYNLMLYAVYYLMDRGVQIRLTTADRIFDIDAAHANAGDSLVLFLRNLDDIRSDAMRQAKVAFKVTSLLLLELGVFPVFCGVWLDLCTLPLFHVTMAHRLLSARSAPLMAVLTHWIAGILFMVNITMFVSILREVLRPRVLFFLRDPNDPDFNPFRDLVEDPVPRHLRRLAISSLIYTNLLVLLVYMPVQITASMAPGVFPLNLRLADPFTELPADMLLFHFFLPLTVEHFKPRKFIKTLLKMWLTFMCRTLNLQATLLPDDPLPAAEHAAIVQPVAAPPGSEPHSQLAAAHTPSPDSARSTLAIRIGCLCVATWMAMVGCHTTLLVLPISVGRWIFHLVVHLSFTAGAASEHGNDFYAFGIGCYIMWGGFVAGRYLLAFLQTHSAQLLLLHILKWAGIFLKSVLLLFVWFVVIPLLIGVLFELFIIMPLRVPINESPVFLLYQDWALGILLLKMWTRMALHGQGVFLIHPSWRTKLEQVKNDGFARLNAIRVVTEILFPVLMNLLTALCFPYAFAKGLIPLFGFSDLMNSLVYRYCWIGAALGMAVTCSFNKAQEWVKEIHNSIRDDRYLIGRQLHNFGI